MKNERNGVLAVLALEAQNKRHTVLESFLKQVILLLPDYKAVINTQKAIELVVAEETKMPNKVIIPPTGPIEKNIQPFVAAFSPLASLKPQVVVVVVVMTNIYLYFPFKKKINYILQINIHIICLSCDHHPTRCKLVKACALFSGE